MAGFFDNVLKGFLGGDYLKDYRHASKTFTSAGYALAPRLKYLFHVYFNVNTTEIPGLTKLFGARDSSRVSVLTKSIQLPNYTFDIETMNQYNRKRNIQTKINYEPVQVDFHDDSSDIVRSLWFAYYNYFYKDPAQAYGGNQSTQSTNLLSGTGIGDFVNGILPINTDDIFGGIQGPASRGNQADQNARDIYAPDKIGNDWGYIGEGVGGAIDKPQFFRDITIYGFNQHSFVSYTLVNPIITDFRHDTYDYSAGGDSMSNSMTIKFESVKYGSGAIGKSQVPGFNSSEHYDTVPSSLSRPGTTNSFFGQGGILDAGVGAFEDLSQGNLLGAVIKGGSAVYNYSKIDDPNDTFKEEINAEASKEIRKVTGNPATSATVFPSPSIKKAKTRAQVIEESRGSLAPLAQNETRVRNSGATSNGQNVGVAGIGAVSVEAESITSQEEIFNPPGWPVGTVLERRTTLEDVSYAGGVVVGAVADSNTAGGAGVSAQTATIGRMIVTDVYRRPDGSVYNSTPEISTDITKSNAEVVAFANRSGAEIKPKIEKPLSDSGLRTSPAPVDNLTSSTIRVK